MGVTAHEAAFSAMVNWWASYMRWAFPISSGVILDFRPPLRPRPQGWAEIQDDPRADREGPTHVRRPPVHHGRNRHLLRRHPHDDLPQHPHRRTYALTHARRSRAIRPVLRDRH